MEIVFRTRTFLDIECGKRALWSGREFVIVQYSIATGEGPKHAEYSVTLALPEECRGIGDDQVVLNLDSDARIHILRVAGDFASPECPFDFPAALRERIVEEVTLHGETYRCSLELSSAFAGWEHSQINEWCTNNNLVITANTDGRIVIKLMRGRSLSEVRAELKEQRAIRIRAQVAAMDWPELFEDHTLTKVIEE